MPLTRDSCIGAVCLSASGIILCCSEFVYWYGTYSLFHLYQFAYSPSPWIYLFPLIGGILFFLSGLLLMLLPQIKPNCIYGVAFATLTILMIFLWEILANEHGNIWKSWGIYLFIIANVLVLVGFLLILIDHTKAKEKEENMRDR